MKNFKIILFAFLLISANTIASSPCTIVLNNIGSDNQESCVSTDIVSISYTVSDVANVYGLPSGITANYSAGICTIEGQSAIVGVHNYTVTITGGVDVCSDEYGVIEIHALPTVEVVIDNEAKIGDVDSVCSNKGVVLSCDPSNADLNWSTSNGLGSFDDPTLPLAIYTPDSQDELNTITFQISATSNNSCAADTDPVLDNISVFINPLPSAHIAPAGNQCEDGESPIVKFVGKNTVPPYTFSFTVDGDKFTNDSKESKSGKEYGFIVPTGKTQQYLFSLETVTDINGCEVEVLFDNTDTVEIFRKPFADFILNKKTTTLYEPTILIEETSIDATIYEWSFGDRKTSDLIDPEEHSYPDSGSYSLTLRVSNESGCLDSTTQIVRIEMPTSVYFPNSFTPNDDDLNDLFVPKGDGIREYALSIYNRAGQKIFETHDAEEGWDGQDHSSTGDLFDAYVYVLLVTDLKYHEYTYRGSLSLYR